MTATVIAGVDVRAHGARYGEPLTVVRTVPNAYGCTRYLVLTTTGAQLYAVGPETT